MANKCDKCKTCVDKNTDYWQRPCFICVLGDEFHSEDTYMNPYDARKRWSK